uniref:kynurenine--oxoglutarate transaminase n=1 Tax=Elaeophora elaphi TaxID=1147741 RepID=A0A0R3S065_9BILA
MKVLYDFFFQIKSTRRARVEFTSLAAEYKAVNIGQGFPDTPMPRFVSGMLEDVAKHPERTDWHQYSQGFGHPRLTNALARLYSSTLGVNVDEQQNVLVTVGAYLSLYYSFMGWLNDGDEVIERIIMYQSIVSVVDFVVFSVLNPAFYCYVPQIRMAGSMGVRQYTPIPVVFSLPLEPQSSKDYTLNVKVIEEKISKRTKMIVLNNPHNPTGKLFTQEELEKIAEIVNHLLVVADEVYEWHVYGDKKMIHFASLPDMYKRTITIGSAAFNVAFNVTGWKLVSAQKLTVLQQAVIEAFEKELDIIKANRKESYLLKGITSELIQQRDRMASILRSAGMEPIIPGSGYFMVANFSQLGESVFFEDPEYSLIPKCYFRYSLFKCPFKITDGSNDPLDFRFVQWMCREKKLAMVPNSAFYTDSNKQSNDHFIRVCFFEVTVFWLFFTIANSF